MKNAVLNYVRLVGGFGRNAKLYLVSALLRAVSMSLSGLLLNLYLIGMGFDVAYIGLCNTLSSVGSMVCSLPAGIIADRIGRKRAMGIGLVGMAATFAGVSLSSNGAFIAAMNLLYGVIGSLLLTSVAPFLTENSTKNERATLFTLSASLMLLISFLMTVGAGYMPRLFAAVLHVGPESTAAYRGVMLLAAVALALALLPIMAFDERPRAHETAPSSVRIWQRISRPRLLVKLMLPRTLIAFGAGLVFPFINLFYKQRFGVSDATLGWILGGLQVTAALVMLVGAGVADRLGKIQTMFIARLFSVPLLLIVGLARRLPVAVAAHWTRSGFMRIGDPLYMAFAMEKLPEEERATGSSILALSWDVGWSTGPYVSGLLQGHTGWSPLFVGTAAFYILSLSLVYWFFLRPGSPDREQRPAPSEAGA